MNLLIRISPKASQDLDDLFHYLVRENENIALKFFDSSRETIALDRSICSVVFYLI
jgi:toxin ParE1/3/4